MKQAFYIDYPQTTDSKTHSHWCKFCNISTTVINGLLENHHPQCEYRLSKELELHSALMDSKQVQRVAQVVDVD